MRERDSPQDIHRCWKSFVHSRVSSLLTSFCWRRFDTHSYLKTLSLSLKLDKGRECEDPTRWQLSLYYFQGIKLAARYFGAWNLQTAAVGRFISICRALHNGNESKFSVLLRKGK